MTRILVAILLAFGCADATNDDGTPRSGDAGTPPLPVDRDARSDGAASDAGVGPDLGDEIDARAALDSDAPDAGADSSDERDASAERDAIDPDVGGELDIGEAFDGEQADANDPDANDPDASDPDADDPDADEPDANAPQPILGTADDVILRALPSNGLVRLEWDLPDDEDWNGLIVVRSVGRDNSRPEDEVAYRPDDGFGESIVIFAGEGDGWTDEGLENGVTYFYRAFSYDGGRYYSRGVSASVAPSDPNPGAIEIYSVLDNWSELWSIELVRDPVDDSLHAVVGGHPDEMGRGIWYLRCTDGCDASEDWRWTRIIESASPQVYAATIALSPEGTPIVAYRNAYHYCGAGCDDAANWATVALPDANDDHDPRITVDTLGVYWIASRANVDFGGLSAWHCARVCSRAENWTLMPLGNVGTLKVAALVAGPTEDLMVLAAHTGGNSNLLSGWRCGGGCDNPDNWVMQRIRFDQHARQAGFRFARGPRPGTRMLTTVQRAYHQCDNCAPDAGPERFRFEAREMDGSTAGLELSSADQPRALLQGRGELSFWTCDFDCEERRNWSARPLGLEPLSPSPAFLIDRQEMPVVMAADVVGVRRLVLLRGRR